MVPTYPDMVMTLLSISELLMNVPACKGWSVFMCVLQNNLQNLFNIWSALRVLQLLTPHFNHIITPTHQCFYEAGNWYTFRQHNKYRFNQCCFLFSQICCTLFMFFLFAPSLLFFNFWPIHNGCCVSQGGVGFWGLRALQRDRVREGKGDIESGRLTGSLSQALATKQKRRLFASVKRRRNHSGQ